MNKLELNDKVAELYNKADSLFYVTEMDDLKQPVMNEVLLIDDWNRLMDLAVDNKIFEVFECRQTDNYFSLRNRANLQYTIILNKDHESPQEATRYAIAMALVKLAEDK